jgi:hypothetical protein
MYPFVKDGLAGRNRGGDTRHDDAGLAVYSRKPGASFYILIGPEPVAAVGPITT